MSIRNLFGINKFETTISNQKKVIDGLRKHLSDCGERSRKLYKALNKALADNEYFRKIAKTLMEKFKNPPANHAIFWRIHPGGKPDEVDILSLGCKEVKKVIFLVSGKDPKTVKSGSLVELGGQYDGALVEVLDLFPWGEEVKFREKLSEEIILVAVNDNQLEQCYLSPELKAISFKEGDGLLNCKGIITKVLPKTEEKEHLRNLEEVELVEWSQVGGLSNKIKQIKRTLLPFKLKDEYENKLKGKRPSRGIILHGPEGCGKTLCAKAIATDLARYRGTKFHFIEITGARLTDKYVGKTAGKLRELFARAKEKADDQNLVVVFIDEIDSLFRNRDTAEHEPWMATDIGQFNGILDGIEPLGNVIVIGATNHKDLVDKAILRPGRLGIDIYISRPKTRKDIKEILRIHLTKDLPFAKKYFEKDAYEYINHFKGGKVELAELNKEPEKIKEHFIDMIVSRLFYMGPPLEVTFNDNGEETVLVNNRFKAITEDGENYVWLKDRLSGAVLEGIVEKARMLVLERYGRLKEENKVAELEFTKKDFFLAIDEELDRLKNSFKGVKEKDIGFKV